MKTKKFYRCSSCGYETSGYFGKCPSCGRWGTLEEIIENEKKVPDEDFIRKSDAKKISEIDIKSDDRIITSIGELNRVLGNGIVKDSVTILTAKPGAGKSTILLQLSEDLAKKDLKILYASGEESDTQIRNRADRLNIRSDNIYILSTNSINNIEAEVKKLNPDILIVDSIQTVKDDNLPQKSGSPTQIMEVANKIVEMSKYDEKKRASFIVGQMTKADELAGVRSLEHLVDCVLILESSDSDQIRVLSSSKNRYGDTGEIGFFEMTENGLISIDNPSEYFVSDSDFGYGKSLTVIRNGSRYIIGEIESLVSKSYFPYPQRISESVKRDNFNIIASILEEVAGIPLEDKNIIVKSTGGTKIEDVSADLSIAMSIASSYFKKNIDKDTVFCGELGLSGEIKKVRNFKNRINEVYRMGYKRIVVSKSQEIYEKYDNFEILKFDNIKELTTKFFK